MSRAILCAVIAASIGCAGEVPPIEEPLRPPEKEEKVKAPKVVKKDCKRITIADQKPAIKYKQRSIDEADNLANEGFDMLRAAEKRGLPRGEVETLVTSAVDKFIIALLADPYNVHATYNLAAAYARIRRDQCALNLLARLREMRRLASLNDKVEAKIDRLLGRKKYEGRRDRDFDNLRDDRRFRKLIRQLNPATR